MTLTKVLLAGRDNQLQQELQKFTDQLFSADCIADITDLADQIEPEMIVLDSTVARNNVYDFLNWAKRNELEIPVVVAGNDIADKTSQEIIDAGAFDYLKGGEDNARLTDIVAAIKTGKSQCDPYVSSDCPSGVNIVGKSEACKRSLKLISVVAKSNCNPILIVGETGTGKELAARAVHQFRHGNSKPFVAINCAALTANLLESELFGHVKGSFTSAEREKTGLLELAENGSIFLDEISEMPLELQAKLLRVIQERTFRKVGGVKDIQCKATIIATSNRDLIKEVEENNFRRDLYYRLSVCPIKLQPLRAKDRIEDIETLANYFVSTSDICPEKQSKIKGFTALAMKALKKHDWPGNVRELKNVVDRAILLENADKIGLSSLMLNPESISEDPVENVSRATKCFSLERAEKELIAKALDEAGWQKTRAAAMLGITRATLYSKVKQYNLQQTTVDEAAIA